MTTKIYTLTDSNTNEVRYVGKANDPKKRFLKHCVISNKKTHKTNWINKLINEGKKPILDIIDEVSINQWIFWETYWISQFKAWGFKLTNNTHGGDGCTFGNQTSFKKGHKLGVGRELSDETKDKIRKVRLGSTAGEKTKIKMSNIRKGKPPINISMLVKSGITTRFEKNKEPWNKGKTGHKLGGLRTSKPVQQFDLDNNLICEFIGYTEASNITNISREGIRKCCNGKANKAGGYKWKWKI